MKCENCGFENVNDAIFCENCGKRVKSITYCKFCGKPLTGLEEYCAGCNRDKDGNVRNAFQQVKKAMDAIPEIKTESVKHMGTAMKTDNTQERIVIIGISAIMIFLMLTKWIRINALSELQSVAESVFGYGFTMDNEFSLFKLGMTSLNYYKAMGADAPQELLAIGLIATGVTALIIIVFIGAIIKAFGEEDDAYLFLQIGSAVTSILIVCVILGTHFINAAAIEGSDGLVPEFMTVMFPPYALIIIAVALFLKGISVIRNCFHKK